MEIGWAIPCRSAFIDSEEHEPKGSLTLMPKYLTIDFKSPPLMFVYLIPLSDTNLIPPSKIDFRASEMKASEFGEEMSPVPEQQRHMPPPSSNGVIKENLLRIKRGKRVPQ